MTSTKHIEIVPIVLSHVEGFHRALDDVARERKYLSIFEAFSVQAMSDFVLHQNKTSGPAFVACRAGEVIGWCDIRRHALPAFAHRGSVGMGVMAKWRGHGIGFRLLDAALDAAFRQGFARVRTRGARRQRARYCALRQDWFSCARDSLRIRFSSTANISTPYPWRSSAGHRLTWRCSPLRDVVGRPWPVSANGRYRPSHVRKRRPSATACRRGLALR